MGVSQSAVRGLIVLAVTASLGGCVSGRGLAASQVVPVYSYPAGAHVVTSYGNSCTTPCRVPLPLDRGGSILVSLSGFEPQKIEIGSRVSARHVSDTALDGVDPLDAGLNLAFAALSGPGVYKELERNRVEVVLKPLDEAKPEDGQSLSLASEGQ